MIKILSIALNFNKLKTKRYKEIKLIRNYTFKTNYTFLLFINKHFIITIITIIVIKP